MQSKIPLYPYNAKTAQERGEIEKWRESFRENCACMNFTIFLSKFTSLQTAFPVFPPAPAADTA